MAFLKLTDLELSNKRVLIRSDLNVPIQDGRITSDARITASLPTIKYCLENGAKVLVMSHLGRPREGHYSAEDSLQPVSDALRNKLKREVRLISDYLERLPEIDAGELVLLENVRFNVGEGKDNEILAKQYAELCDVFVMDAFGTAHRAQASTHGVGKFAPQACAGLLVAEELQALEQALANPKRPMLAIVGGSKVSTKLTVLESLANKVDQLIVGGGIANTFLAAAGLPIGKSLCEQELIPIAKKLMDQMKERGASIPIATDVVCGKKFDAQEPAIIKSTQEVESDDLIFDLGPNSSQIIAELIEKAGTIIWNGPIGVFEFDQFGNGTKMIAKAIAEAHGFSLAGGGDTIAAIQKYDIYDQISYISTAGGAFLEYLEGKTLPAIAMLEQRAKLI